MTSRWPNKLFCLRRRSALPIRAQQQTISHVVYIRAHTRITADPRQKRKLRAGASPTDGTVMPQPMKSMRHARHTTWLTATVKRIFCRVSVVRRGRIQILVTILIVTLKRRRYRYYRPWSPCDLQPSQHCNERCMPTHSFFDCINKADRQLIATGIRIRGEQQRSGCSIDPNLAWFCDLNNGRGTLAAFERVNLSIFLRDLDSDDATAKPRQWQRQWQQQPFQFIKWWTGRAVRGSYVDETLSQLEQRRSNDLWMYIQNGKTVADAAASEDVISDEKRILGKLAVDAIY
mmetsp:Transcript_18434/g.22872  ORF Transcript_18434/g.22872 Transcript_18434/m.22872 type:complete len:289 (+) Transcript_18434:326-1192(+)